MGWVEDFLFYFTFCFWLFVGDWGVLGGWGWVFWWGNKYFLELVFLFLVTSKCNPSPDGLGSITVTADQPITVLVHCKNNYVLQMNTSDRVHYVAYVGFTQQDGSNCVFQVSLYFYCFSWNFLNILGIILNILGIILNILGIILNILGIILNILGIILNILGIIINILGIIINIFGTIINNFVLEMIG